MRVIFLDFDGVLNSMQSEIYWRRKLGPPDRLLFKEEFCPIACSNLLHLLEEDSGLMLVISSSWRVGHTIEQLQDILEAQGIPRQRVIGATEDRSLKGKERGNEIQDWLDKHAEVTEFVILDDDADMAHLKDKLVRTTWMHGLQYADVIEVQRRFGHWTLKNPHKT
jgi:hypothetical protein